jgi:hypothetical protein
MTAAVSPVGPFVFHWAVLPFLFFLKKLIALKSNVVIFRVRFESLRRKI